MAPYEWDEAKYAANLEKHGVGFELVYEFDWTNAPTAGLASGGLPSSMFAEGTRFGSSAFDPHMRRR
jgi:hypothetical protein